MTKVIFDVNRKDKKNMQINLVKNAQRQNFIVA